MKLARDSGALTASQTQIMAFSRAEPGRPGAPGNGGVKFRKLRGAPRTICSGENERNIRHLLRRALEARAGRFLVFNAENACRALGDLSALTPEEEERLGSWPSPAQSSLWTRTADDGMEMLAADFLAARRLQWTSCTSSR
jgi:hypothetical protein